MMKDLMVWLTTYLWSYNPLWLSKKLILIRCCSTQLLMTSWEAFTSRQWTVVLVREQWVNTINSWLNSWTPAIRPEKMIVELEEAKDPNSCSTILLRVPPREDLISQSKCLEVKTSRKSLFKTSGIASRDRSRVRSSTSKNLPHRSGRKRKSISRKKLLRMPLHLWRESISQRPRWLQSRRGPVITTSLMSSTCLMPALIQRTSAQWKKLADYRMRSSMRRSRLSASSSSNIPSRPMIHLRSPNEQPISQL